MAAGTLPAPGTKYGPCEGGCEHKDCAITRKTAEAICHWCMKAIGYDRAFYNDDKGGQVHAVCEEEAIEREEAR